ncbi:membrane biogenesis protein [Citrobacter freundii]|jgi:predicted TIM-barrel enzyme|uniref:Membrane biogenesis protein n=2 Tax=Enterobacteriaceae TaxID=543 RepID=A0ABD7B0V5_CITFR|nr:membrane biogenesis protein [Citrobacter freundii]MBD0826140.1 membrane biogenesis protein [Citrobacter sp. C1]RFU92858.1 membrane biogenesis protein [Citrobacter gillenii]TKV18288.1 membrane biogenesis protein [Citrobacter sp. wls613]QCA19348.1 membrane biogenesis protein [Citrobacter freundii]
MPGANMKNKVETLFGDNKFILAMLHLKGENDRDVLENAKKEIAIYQQNGVDAVIVENYFGTPAQVESVLHYLDSTQPGITYGVNLLDDDKKGFELAKKYHASFIQLDSVAGHLPVDEDLSFAQFIEENRRNASFAVFGGVRFKYQPYKSGRSLQEDLTLGMQRCDAIVVTGDATGQETDEDKIREFRAIIGDFPLIIGAGITLDNCQHQLTMGSGAVVGSYFKDTYKDTGDVCAEHVSQLMQKVKQND